MDFEKANSFIESVKEKYEKKAIYKERYFYDNKQMKYFDIVWFNFKNNVDLARHLMIKPKELEELRVAWVLPTYQGICYLDWWKEGYYNLLKKENILKPNNNPNIHPLIESLIKNLCNNKKENIDYLLKSILYKYTHLNDVYIPAVIFHWVGWSWKGLFVKLLSQIFWEENTQTWLTQDNMDSKFSAYSWQKLVVEFKEIMVENTIKWKKNMNKLKALIMEDKIMIEKKGQDAITVENIAWFIMSSNENKPVHLDNKDSGNRRFSIIKTWWKIENWKEIEEAIMKRENIESFLAFLFQKFPETEKETRILALENEDKEKILKQSESIWNLFFQWFEEKYPEINIITNLEREALIFFYRKEIWDLDDFEDWYKTKFFNAWLSMKYDLINTKIRDQQQRWYKINKKWRCFTKEESLKITKILWF